MAGGYKHTPQDIDALAAQLRRLQAQLDSLRGSASARNTTVSGGGGFTIKDGGRFRVVDPDGDVLVDAGAFTEYAPRLDGKPQVGWALRRDSGELAAICYTNVSGTKQAWQWFDLSGNVILADDAVSNTGLARPYVPWTFGLARDTDWPGSTSATYQDLWRGEVFRQHPQLKWSIGLTTSTSGTTGDVRVLVDGTQVGTTRAATFSSVLLASETNAITSIGGHETSHIVTVQARRTAGTGAVQVGVFGLWGVQS